MMKAPACNLGVRWTIGDVSPRGWEALRLSVHCAVRLFGPQATYTICANTVPLHAAQQLAGDLPEAVRWLQVSAADLPDVLRPHLDTTMAEGVGWKLVPLQLFADRHELALDNDCILWRVPTAVKAWLATNENTLLAADTDRCLGMFQQAPNVPGTVNSGIRGLPPSFSFGAALGEVLREKALELGHTPRLRSELDEQGLQAVALHRHAPALIVETSEVSICSPFWPRNPELGTCGAHFVGLNSKAISWNYFDRPGLEVRQEHWDRHRPELYRRAGLPMPPALSR